MTAATDYWRCHYADEFRFGQGTEDILAMLLSIPPVSSWVDLGCGSESLLWFIALQAQRLIAVDADPERLAILRRFAAAGQPRPAYTTALALCGRTDPSSFTQRCRSLRALIQADCLSGTLPPDPHLTPASADLVTQFGLLGLTRDPDQFVGCFTNLHRLLAPDGWAAGANWIATHTRGRVELTESLYRQAAARAGIRFLRLRRIETTDPAYPVVWMYLGRTTPCPPTPRDLHRPAT